MEYVVVKNCRIEESFVMKLDYLQCMVKEAFQLQTPFPLLVLHKSMESYRMRGHFIMPNTIICEYVGYGMGWKIFGKRLISLSLSVSCQDF
ncbi:hypothetical protein SUGI_0639540 [Cryptomeria japonica]|nr:hypothetical protein SUGI_0639540 [Cryptomeria japonica]